MHLHVHHHRRQKNVRLALACIVLSCGAGAAPSPARAQTSANLTLVSAYTARGITFDPRPTPQLRVEHDAADGWYAGGFASRVKLASGDQGQLSVYGGRARRITSTLTLDAGISHTSYTRDSRFRYTEAYAGLMAGQASARVFYSPDYYGMGRTVYVDLNTSYPLTERWSLALHGGVLHPFGAYEGEAAHDARDVRIGLAADLGDYRLQVGWQTTWHPYLDILPRARAWTASASVYF